ncbi:Lipase [Nymphaea thermarum]|nr:Lipase [Nymphaea thermarum]
MLTSWCHLIKTEPNKRLKSFFQVTFKPNPFLPKLDEFELNMSPVWGKPNALTLSQGCFSLLYVSLVLKLLSLTLYNDNQCSLQNWIEDLFWKQLDLNYPGMHDAMVHHGFYSAYHNTSIRPGVVNAVQRAWELYGRIGVLVTGHSMGGAMASFCALDLKVNYGANITQLITFGQPRVGNSVFASYFSEHVPATFRITNEHDMVPHLPPYYTYFSQKTYHHFPREVWLYTLGVGSLVYRIEQVCDSSGEDPSCSRSVSGNSISDHLNYLGVELQAETWGSCKIVTDSSIIKKVGIGSSNFVLTRDSSSLTLKNSYADNGSLSSPQYLISHSKV